MKNDRTHYQNSKTQRKLHNGKRKLHGNKGSKAYRAFLRDNRNK